MYFVVVILLTILLPIGSALIEQTQPNALALPALLGEWYAFWAVGVRLVLAGARQSLQPRFTAREIFKGTTDEPLPVVRELGFANLAIGTLGVASFFARDFILPASIAGAIFYGLAGAAHAFRRGKGAHEWMAMITDLLVFSILALNVFGRLAALTVD